MEIDQRLNDIDDCLYRVAVRALIINDDKVLLVHNGASEWWEVPGGGVEHGETVESTLVREIEEELGVPADKISSDFQIAYYNIGQVVTGVPRMNFFFTASVPAGVLKTSEEVAEWKWLSREEFMQEKLHPSYGKAELAAVIFGG